MPVRVGDPLDRVDGRLKVRGSAEFATENALAGQVHAVLFQSAIARGRILSIDAVEAERAPGVLFILTHANATRPAAAGFNLVQPGEEYPLLQDDIVHYSGQHLGLVVAETLEQARHAAGLIRVRYQEEAPTARLDDALDRLVVPRIFRAGYRPPDSERGDPLTALASAPVKVEATYSTPVAYHNPIEPHAVTALWEGEKLTVIHSTQSITGSSASLSKIFGIPVENVQTICRFVGGGFGSKGAAWPHVVLTAMAARAVGRPVKLVLTRRQMYSATGFRSRTIQQIRIGADADGRLSGVIHDAAVQTATFGACEFVEPAAVISESMYSCANVAVSHRVAAIDCGMPGFMRAPGLTPGSFALESAMDELSYALGMDPVELRLRNYADQDQHEGKPWSSNSLRECYARAAGAFGWAKRDPRPGSMKEGDRLIGWGMAASMHPYYQMKAAARVELSIDGTAIVQSGTQDLGTGTYTIMAQLTADILGLPIAKVKAELGDSRLPPAPVSGGSMTAASVTPAIKKAAEAVRGELFALATAPSNGPLNGARAADLGIADGFVYLVGAPSRREHVRQILERAGRSEIAALRECEPGSDTARFAMQATGAHFVEIAVDPELGELRVRRYVGAFAAGRILNAKMARSQIIGGVIGGIGMALSEQAEIDHRSGRVVNANISEYLVPVHADVPELEVLLIEEQDPYVNAVGVKGIGELSIVGMAGAIANAVYHATGKRIRDLPIRPDKILA